MEQNTFLFISFILDNKGSERDEEKLQHFFKDQLNFIVQTRMYCFLLVKCDPLLKSGIHILRPMYVRKYIVLAREFWFDFFFYIYINKEKNAKIKNNTGLKVTYYMNTISFLYLKNHIRLKSSATGAFC